MGTQRQTPSLRQPEQIVGLGQVSKRLNEKAGRGEELSWTLAHVSADFLAHLWFVASVKKKTMNSGVGQA